MAQRDEVLEDESHAGCVVAGHRVERGRRLVPPEEDEWYLGADLFEPFERHLRGERDDAVDLAIDE